MIDAQLLAELAQSGRLLTCHRQNPNIVDMLYDLEDDFVQKADDIESRKWHSGGKLTPWQESDGIRASTALRSS
jgi:hypothetical protein